MSEKRFASLVQKHHKFYKHVMNCESFNAYDQQKLFNTIVRFNKILKEEFLNVETYQPPKLTDIQDIRDLYDQNSKYIEMIQEANYYMSNEKEYDDLLDLSDKMPDIKVPKSHFRQSDDLWN